MRFADRPGLLMIIFRSVGINIHYCYGPGNSKIADISIRCLLCIPCWLIVAVKTSFENCWCIDSANKTARRLFQPSLVS